MKFDEQRQLCLDSLEVPADQYRLDRMRPYRDRATGKRVQGFETLASCWAEDVRRARALRALPKEIYEGIFQSNPEEIAELLEQGAASKQRSKHPASAAYLQGRRSAFLGSILKLVHQSVGDDLGFVRITHPNWRFGLQEKWLEPGVEDQDSFERLLSGVRLWDFPGFLIAVLSGVYDQQEDKIQLAWCGICSGINCGR
jgi:hypothetical protein